MDAIHSGELNNAKYNKMDVFGVEVPTKCDGVPSEILNPRDTWEDKKDFDKTARNLAQMMIDNFTEYIDEAGDIAKGGPKL